MLWLSYLNDYFLAHVIPIWGTAACPLIIIYLNTSIRIVGVYEPNLRF